MAYSRYGKSGKGLTDRGTRRYAARVARKHGKTSAEYKDVTTFTTVAGLLKAKGSFQTLGHTAATLGFGGEGLKTAPTTHVWGVGDMGKGFYSISEHGLVFTGTQAQRAQKVQQAAAVSRGMVGEQTTRYSGAPTKGYGKASMGGMRKGDWQRPQKPKKDAKGGAGIGTVIAVGGVGYLLWSLLK